MLPEVVAKYAAQLIHIAQTARKPAQRSSQLLHLHSSLSALGRLRLHLAAAGPECRGIVRCTEIADLCLVSLSKHLPKKALEVVFGLRPQRPILTQVSVPQTGASAPR